MTPDSREELRAIVAGLRVHLEARGRSGALGVPLRVAAPAPTKPLEPASAPATQASGPPPPRGAVGLTQVREELGDCQRCRLAQGRRNIVFGVGNPEAHLVFVGEAPGADEDRQGEPFVGLAGQLLTRMIQAIGYEREDVYICNVLKCRPPHNRDPEPDEIDACRPFLARQLAALSPRLIVTLGRFAGRLVTGLDLPVTRLRGTFRTYEGIPVMPTFHPAFLLRNEERKRDAWEDLKQVLAALRRMGIEPPRPPRAR